MDKLRIGYASYSINVLEEKRELFGRMLAGRLQAELQGILGTEIEMIYCPARQDVVRAIDTGCTVLITEGKLKRSEGARDGDENIGTGTIKDWTGLPGMQRVILILAPEDHPTVTTKKDGSKAINARKVVELYRRGYYDALYINDMSAANIAHLIQYGRKEAEAKDYYQVTDEMLEILLAGERAKNERNRKKTEHAGIAGLFTDTQTAKSMENVADERKEQPVSAEESPEPAMGKETEQPQKEDMSSSDILQSLLSGGVDAYLDSLDNWQTESAQKEESESAQEDMDGFDFEDSIPEDDGEDDMTEEEMSRGEPETAMEQEIRLETGIAWVDANEEYAVLDTRFDLEQLGRISRYMQGGTLLVVDLPNPPQEQDANRYGVTIIQKGREKGYVHNGRYQSSAVVFTGYCIKTIMQRSVLIEVPDEEAPGEYVAGKDCYVTFTPLD